MYKPIILIILDGFGTRLETQGNAIAAAETPMFDMLDRHFPFTTLQASSSAVGLPFGEPGNSEVGHLTIGAGRPFFHHLPRIITAIRDGSFYQNPAFLKAKEHVVANNSNLHLLGLVSSGSVHSYAEHIYALCEFTKREGIERVFLHIITDGKDAPPQGGEKFIAELEERIAKEYPHVRIASLVGRFYAMDRDEKWDRVRTAYELLTQGAGEAVTDVAMYLHKSYAAGVSDEFLKPAVVTGPDGAPAPRITDNDALIIFNFREDSVREISEVFAAERFEGFSRKKLENFFFVTMTEYEKELAAVSAFPPLPATWSLGKIIAESGKTQLRIAESEKYAHVTYFFNGGNEKPFVREDRILVPSLLAEHFDEVPEMRAKEISEAILKNFSAYDLIIANFANADMVGHTGNFDAAVKGVEALDRALAPIVEQVRLSDSVLIITADHGNAEQKINSVSGERITKHTINPVPFYLVGKAFERKIERTDEEIRQQKSAVGGVLSDIAPTVLDLMGIEKQPEMTGESLLPQLLQ
ncbi:MAG: 2,3-bisphosphoglycerate-independent phosphoglycerate mutase [bacterium]|nr:2,3-bisphosphoglycerate-independent phosphoglycerate mutase [bacterium]